MSKLTPKVRVFIYSVLVYAALSVASQYGSSVVIPMEWLLAGLFLPISCFTVIPLLDCARSFSQHYGEQAELEQKKIFNTLFWIPFFISLIACMFGGLPATIFLGAIVATNLGGAVDILVFKWMRKFSDKPYVRMAVSNASATFAGSQLFFFTAFSGLVPEVASWIGIDFVNTLQQESNSGIAMSALMQSGVIWVFAVTFGTLLDKIRVKFTK